MPFDFSRYCIPHTASIRDASACIDGNRAKIALVVDSDGRLLDTVTDGDIRRAILAGLEMSALIPMIRSGKLQRATPPVTAPERTERSVLLQLMRTRRVRQVPLLDADGRVVDLVTQSELETKSALPVHAVIMAGGFGIRLRPLTEDIPKPMLPVGDRPLLEVIIERLREAGIRRISLLTHYKADVIMKHFGDGSAFGVEIDYVQEDEPLGTAGALSLLKVGSEPLLVLNGDILTRTDYAALLDFHCEHHAEITIGVREYDFRVPYGVVDTEGVRVKAITEKPVVKYFVNAGIYLLAPGVRDHLPTGERCDMPTLINARSTAGAQVVSFPVHEYWLDIGHLDDYRKADADVRDGTVQIFQHMNWNQQTVLVTGAGGFIGSHLTERLASLGAKTRALVRYNSRGAAGWLDGSPLRREIDVRFGDIRDADSTRRAMEGATVVFHLAALIGIPYSYEAPLSYVRTNIEGTLNVLQLARELGVQKVIQTSTSEVYGNAPEFPITEHTPVRGQSPYSASKIASDQLALSYHCSFQLPVVVLRPFNTYGPRQSARAIIPTIIAQALAEKDIHLGSLTPSRDLTHVADTCEGFVKAAESARAVGETIQLGTGRDVSVGDLAAMILKLLGKDLPIVTASERIRPSASEIDRLLSSPQRAKELLGWEPKLTLEDGLQTVIDWMRENLSAFQTRGYIV